MTNKFNRSRTPKIYVRTFFFVDLLQCIKCADSMCCKFICSDCGAKDSEGKRPLHFAAYGKGSHARDVVDVLIEKGAREIGEF